MVDDDRVLCDLLSDFLADEGYAVSRASGGQDAIVRSAKLGAPVTSRS